MRELLVLESKKKNRNKSYIRYSYLGNAKSITAGTHCFTSIDRVKQFMTKQDLKMRFLIVIL